MMSDFLYFFFRPFVTVTQPSSSVGGGLGVWGWDAFAAELVGVWGGGTALEASSISIFSSFCASLLLLSLVYV